METGGDNQPQPDIAPGGVQEAKESLDDKIARVKCVDFFTEWKKCICKYYTCSSSVAYTGVVDLYIVVDLFIST